MAINVSLVEQDLSTTIKNIGYIEINDDFYTLRRIAQEMKLSFIATIDDAGDTIINRLQLDLLKAEIKKLRTNSNVSQAILDQLEEVAYIADPANGLYIKFMGD